MSLVTQCPVHPGRPLPCDVDDCGNNPKNFPPPTPSPEQRAASPFWMKDCVESAVRASEEAFAARRVNIQSQYPEHLAVFDSDVWTMRNVRDQTGRSIQVSTLNAVKPRRVKWLWDGRIPMGEATLIVGRGGTGKSTILASMAAQITNGTMEGEFFNVPRNVLYVANEDSYEYTVVPRLMAAGADTRRIHRIDAKEAGKASSVILPFDCEQLGEIATNNQAVAIMLDPLSSNLEARKNSQDEMRPAMERVRRMAENAGVAVMGLGHTRKAISVNLMDAILGSTELGNVVRSAIGVMADPEEKGVYVLSQEKNNLGRLDIPSKTYRIEPFTFEFESEMIRTSRIEWGNETEKTVSDMLADAVQTAGNGGALKEAAEFLRDFLESQGPASRKDVMTEARKEGISASSIGRAKDKLGVITERAGFQGGSTWSLPPSPPSD